MRDARCTVPGARCPVPVPDAGTMRCCAATGLLGACA